MNIKYRTTKYYIEIKRREITRETKSNIFYMGIYFNKPKEFRELKRTDHHCWHDTFDDAKKFLIKRTEDKINNLSQQIKFLSEELSKIKEMTNEKAT